MSLNIEDTTVPYTHQDYKKAVNQYLDQIKKFNDVIAVYQFGSVSVPGISDVDLVIILKDSLIDSQAKDYRIDELDNKTKYILMHQPFILNQDSFKNLHYFFYFTNLQHVYGKRLPFQTIDEKEKKDLALIISIKRLSVLLRNFSFYLTASKIPSRKCLANLNSLKHNIFLIKDILGKNPPNFWFEFVNNVEDLRKNWFSINSKEANDKLLKFLQIAYEIVNQAIQTIDEYLIKIFPDVAEKITEEVYEDDFNKIVIFTDRWNKIDPDIKLSLFRHKKNILPNINKVNSIFGNLNHCSIIFLPITFYFLTNSELLTSCRMRGDSLIRTLTIRNRLIKSHLKFLQTNGFDYGWFTKENLMRSVLSNRNSFVKKSFLKLLTKYNQFYIRRNLG